MSHSPSPEVATAVAGVRASMAELDNAIAALRDEACRLRESADTAMAVALLERPTPLDVTDLAVEDDPVDQAPDLDDEPAFGAPVEGSEPGATEIPEPAVADAAPTVFPGVDPSDAPEESAAVPAADEATVLEFPQRDEEPEQPEPVRGVPTIVSASSAEDGLDAIEETESTDMPDDWNNGGVDDDAFAKFFSNDVEPEPAQRWLLNDL